MTHAATSVKTAVAAAAPKIQGRRARRAKDLQLRATAP